MRCSYEAPNPWVSQSVVELDRRLAGLHQELLEGEESRVVKVGVKLTFSIARLWKVVQSSVKNLW